jgi:hypothetical protein
MDHSAMSMSPPVVFDAGQDARIHLSRSIPYKIRAGGNPFHFSAGPVSVYNSNKAFAQPFIPGRSTGGNNAVVPGRWRGWTEQGSARIQGTIKNSASEER